jgi:hydrogenase maturation factor
VNVSCNDVATSGNRPEFIENVILIPEGSTENQIENIFRSADRASRELDLSILGGHTEVSPGIERPIFVCTSFCVSDRYVSSEMAKSGERILMTKAAGLEGTSILAEHEHVKGRISSKLLERAKNFKLELSIVEEAVTAASTGAVSAMHDCTEGGVLGAVFEMAHASGLGFVLYRERIPIRKETEGICNILQIDPIKLIGSGSLLISTSKPDEVKKSLSSICECTEIGYFTEKGRYIVEGKKSKRVNQPPRDELWKVLART